MIESSLVLAVTTALVQILKTAFKIPSRITPVISIAISVCFVLYFGDMSIKSELFTGLMIGLSASGFYDLSKKTVLNIK